MVHCGNRVALSCMLAAVLASTTAYSQDEQDPEVDKQEYVSIRIHVWSKRYKSVENDGSGLKLKLALSTALFKYRTLDEFLDPETEHINALGVRPKLEFEYPTSIRHVAFVPNLELAINHSFDTRNDLFSGAAKAAWLYRRHGDDRDFKARAGVKFATEFEDDGLNFDDYVELSLRVDLKQIYWFTIGSRRLTITPFGEIKHFTDELRFETESGALFDVTRQYELGLEFSTDPRKKVWGITLPRLKISYAFGDDFRGVKIRL